MSDYIKSTNFTIKDSLTTGDSAKRIRGTEIDAEFNNIATAVNSKANTASPNLTGSPTATTATLGDSSSRIATTAFVAAAIADENLGTIATQDADDVTITGGTIAVTSVSASSGFTGNVTGDVSGNAGTVTNGVYTTNFTGSNQSKATSGYQKLPGGVILQWGTATSTTDDAQSFLFSTSFSTACVFVSVEWDAVSRGQTVFNLTTTGFSINRIDDIDGTQTFRYFAIGY